MELQPAALYQAVIDDTASCAAVDDTSGFAARVLRTTILKKCRDNRSESARIIAINHFCGRARSATPTLPDLSYARGYLHRLLWAIEPEEVVDGMRPGPGSSIDMHWKSTSCFTKIAHGNPTVSSFELYQTYLYLLENYDPCWYSAEILRRNRYGAPRVVNYNRVVCVPKTSEIDRVIAVEPTINSIMQQGVKFALERRLKSVGIDLATQPDKNRHMARLGSMGYGLATVDFTAASDSISRSLVQSLVPRDWFETLVDVSSPSFKVDDEIINADRIMLSMGNATTFPLQTLIFLSLVYQVYAEKGERFAVNETVAVFGDDVILLQHCCERFLELASSVGFLPNPEKTFFSGEFRESCGADWLNGRNVRGVYCRSLKDIGSVLSLRNQLAAWSYRHSVSLPRTLRYLDRYLCKRGFALRVPHSAPIDSGIRSRKGRAVFDKTLYCLVVPRLCVLPPKQRSARRLIRVHSGFVTLGHLLGGLRGGMLMERPLSGPRSGRKKFQFYNWDDPMSGERWMYDCSRTSAGFVSREG